MPCSFARPPLFCYNIHMDATSTRGVVVLGGGAIGSVLAAALARKARQETILVGRSNHVRAINEHGLKVDGLFAEPVRLRAAEGIDFPLNGTLLAVTVKAVDLENALAGIIPFLRPTTSILLLQNGLGIKELALAALRGTPVRADHVFIGIVAMGSTFVAPGEVRCFGGGIRVEPAFAETPQFELLRGLPFKVERSRDIARDLWTKLLVNAVINPLSVLLQGHNRLVAEARFDALKAPILAEGRAVAAAEGVEIEADAAFVNRFVRSDNITSMLQDFRRGRPSEIDFLNGAIAALGRKLRIPTPVNEFVTALIKALELRRQM
jgi:2-dehydropantoate 2-reductase